jgi:glycine hydroxymethyltransferase
MSPTLQSKKVLIASDHAGVALKAALQKQLSEFEWVDLGPVDTQAVDYPDYAEKLGLQLEAGKAERGILICGSGIGMSIAANKMRGIRAALVENPIAAQLSKAHNDANVLCLGSRFVAVEYAEDIVRAFLNTPFSGIPRHFKRIEKMNALEKKSLTSTAQSKQSSLHNFLQGLENADPEIHAAIGREEVREENGLEMIASENYVSCAVLEAQGSCLTNKYAEGYPGKRYYGGCEFVDQIEQLAIDRVCRVFGAEAANVQPHSGSQANMAAYMALMNPGDTILGMSLSHGGHLTHGSSVNFSGKIYKSVAYGLNPSTDRLDYDQIREIAKKEKPKVIVAGASAYPRIINFKNFGDIAKEVGAHLVVDMAHIAGLVAAGCHPSPIPHATYTTSTTHKTLRGPRGGLILCKAEHLKTVNSQIFPGIQGGPLMHVIGAKAVAFGEALQPSFHEYQKQVVENSEKLAEFLMEMGFKLVTDGTDNHLLLVDLTQTGDGSISGKDAEAWLDLAGITVNKNTIPNEKRSPFITSGIRIGVPAITTRGMGVDEMKEISVWIDRALKSGGDVKQLGTIRGEVKRLCERFPLYG